MTAGLMFFGWSMLMWWLGYMDGITHQRRREAERRKGR